MGYLNNSTTVLDAILTKKGRELLSRGVNEFAVTKFALADDEVDYALWDVSHPLGTDYYGTVIENTPLLEPTPNANTTMKYNFDKYTTEEIHKMISDGIITNQEVIDFYNNEWWDDEN